MYIDADLLRSSGISQLAMELMTQEVFFELHQGCQPLQTRPQTWLWDPQKIDTYFILSPEW